MLFLFSIFSHLSLTTSESTNNKPAESFTNKPPEIITNKSEIPSDYTNIYNKNSMITENKLQAVLFFESVLNIESALFLYTIKGKQNLIDKLMDNVYIPFQSILLDLNNKYSKDITPKQQKEFKEEFMLIINSLENYSKNFSSTNRRLTDLLRYRNKLFEEDKSLQSRNIYKQFYDKFIKKIHSKVIIKTDLINNPEDLTEYQKIRKLMTPKGLDIKNLKFVSMIKSLFKIIDSNSNLVKAMNNELSEFLKEFRELKPFDSVLFSKIRAIINLGGNIFLPSMFLDLSKGLDIPNKSEFISKSINKILNPIMLLKEYTEYNNETEKKQAIIEFLKTCRKRAGSKYEHVIDEAMEQRSIVLMSYYCNKNEEEKIKLLDIEQDKVLRSYIKILEETDREKFKEFLIVDNKIKELYVKVLDYGNEKDKESLMSNFDVIFK